VRQTQCPGWFYKDIFGFREKEYKNIFGFREKEYKNIFEFREK